MMRRNHAAALPLALAVMLLSDGGAEAHQLWIEQGTTGATLYFGEFGENLREVSPGELDKMSRIAVKAVSAKAERPVKLTKTAKAYALEGRAAAGESLVAEASDYPLFDEKDGDKTLRTAWTPAARYVADFRAQRPALVLDIVPTGKDGELQVTYRGKPLPNAEVHVVAASGWGRTLETDAQGKVALTFPWQGTYAVEVHHSDKTPGKRKGATGDETYDAASFVTTLSFAIASGLPAIPAPAPAPPSKPE